MKLLLIGPSRYDAKGEVLKYKKILFPRLGLLQLAGLTPKDVEVKIIEEFVEDVDFDADYDLIGISAFTSQASRAYKIADEFKKRGKSVIIGGIHASSLPDEAEQYVDSVVIGEAENLWEQVVEDFRAGNLQPRYQSTQHHDLKNLPVPRYDLVNRSKYFVSTMPVQATRGCPFNCDFCSVTRFFGGTYRVRPVDDVIRDIKASGTKRLFFVDDNVISNKEYAKELFTKLIPLNIEWVSQCVIDLGRHTELCRLAAASGCSALCIGVESINKDSLASVNKKHNRVDEYYELLQAIRKSGISVHLSMIIGLDGDDENIFKDTLEFVSKVKPLRVALHVPMPYPGTKMAENLDKEGRIIHKDWSKYYEGNVVFQPKKLGCEELAEKSHQLYKNIYSLKSVFTRSIAQPPKNIHKAFLNNLLGRHYLRRGLYINPGS